MVELVFFFFSCFETGSCTTLADLELDMTFLCFVLCLISSRVVLTLPDPFLAYQGPLPPHLELQSVWAGKVLLPRMSPQSYSSSQCFSWVCLQLQPCLSLHFQNPTGGGPNCGHHIHPWNPSFSGSTSTCSPETQSWQTPAYPQLRESAPSNRRWDYMFSELSLLFPKPSASSLGLLHGRKC